MTIGRTLQKGALAKDNMRASFIAVLMAVAAAGTLPATAVDLLPNGRYTTGTFSPVTFFCDAIPDGTIVENDDCVGFYDGWTSVVYLTDFLGGGVFQGVWVQTINGVRCASPIAGSFYWGSLEFRFDEALQSWAGNWGFCEEPRTREWFGAR